MSSPPAGAIRAAGAVLVRATTRGPEVLLVHRERYDDWSLPNGPLQEDESHPAAALRESRREAGYDVRLGPPVGAVRYDIDGRPKQVRYWRATATSQPGERTGAEMDGAAWLALDEALEALAHDKEREVVLAASRIAPTVPLLIARHTAARSRDEWPAADPDRPLDERGSRDAVRLAGLITAWAPGRVVCSPARRCVESITPYAGRVTTTVELEPVLSEEEHARRPDLLAPLLEAVIADLRHQLPAAASSPDVTSGPGAVLCTHRPVLPAIAGILGIPLARSDRQEPLPPGGCWVLHLSASGTVAIETHSAPRH